MDVQFQEHAQVQVQRALRHDRLPHAYLFHGPDGVGKELFALGLAELLLCPEPVETTIESGADQTGGNIRIGCGKCKDCRSVAAGSHPDLHLVYRQLSREHPDSVVRKRKALDIGVDVMRHFLIETVGHTAVRGQAKVFIVREADRITVQAQNALLKTLEEPPGNSILILLVSSLDRILPTTFSRCQIIRFRTLPQTFVRDQIASRKPELSAEETEWYAKMSAGSLGSALELVESDYFRLNARLLPGLASVCGNSRSGKVSDSVGKCIEPTAKTWIDESKELAARFRKSDPEISETEAGRRGLVALMGLSSAWYADVVRVISQFHSGVINVQHRQLLEQVSTMLSLKRATQNVNRLAIAARQLDLNANTQLCVETLLNDLRLAD